MAGMRLGVIDVGSNTVHLLVVDAHPAAGAATTREQGIVSHAARSRPARSNSSSSFGQGPEDSFIASRNA